MRQRAKLALAAVAALAACSSAKPSPDDSQSAVTNASAPANSSHAAVFVAMMDSDKKAVEEAVDTLYAHYRKAPEADEEDSDTAPAVDFTMPVTDLMARWSSAQPVDEIDSVLSDADWVCQCQDWPGTGFKFLEKTTRPAPGDRIEASLRFDLGDGQQRKVRILFAQEDGNWRIADLFSADVPKGVVAQMTSDLARWEKK
jgi:hypothetical protein